MEADWVDVGVGFVQCGPYHCDCCGASEIGPEREKVEATLSDEEKRTNFYRSRISPHANTIAGKIVTHRQADAHYRAAFFAEHGNPYNAPIFR